MSSTVSHTLSHIADAAGSLSLFIVLSLAVVLSSSAGAASAGNDRTRVLAAIHDVKAALAEVTDVERDGASSPDPFRDAAQRATNALVGRSDPSFDAKVSTPGDTAGAISDLNVILDRHGTFPWTAPLQGAVANLGAAVGMLEAARKAAGLTKYEVIVTDAVQDLEMALGRPSEAGPLGGLEGVLSSTALGVPSGAQRISACSLPTRGPAYGVYHGYLAFVAMPLRPGDVRLPQVIGERDIAVRGHLLILRTPVAALVTKLCHGHGADKASAIAPPNRSVVGNNKVTGARSMAAGDPPRGDAATGAAAVRDPPRKAGGIPIALYTIAQAEAGRAIYADRCVACHGANLQGVSAPGVAGKAFLATAQSDGWTVWDVEQLIATSMPFNAPGTLTATQQMDALAFILAANCYPSGNSKLSSKEKSVLKRIKLGPLPNVKPDDAALGVCTVK